MKKILSLLSLLLLIFVVGCSSDEKNSSQTLAEATSSATDSKPVTLENYSMVTPTGTPLIAIGGLLNNSKYNISTVTGSDPIVAELTSGKTDIVCAPIASGMKLYAKGGSKYRLISILTSNNIYLVSRTKDPLTDLSVLNGQEIVAYGSGATPQAILDSFIASKKITPTVTYAASAQEISSLFITNTENPNEVTSTTPKYVLMAEPNISQIKKKYNIELNVLDLCKELNINIPQAGVFVKQSMTDTQIDSVIADLEANNKSMNDNLEVYIDTILPLEKTFNALGKDLLLTVKDSYNGFKTDMKADCQTFVNMMNQYNPNFFNGLTVNDTFYYQK